ncbi:MAG: hypothetical protein FJ405_13535 [Verrucomicrobia bacterium]|nr:hypothetical protein [Verrucomicrobiota bacterium]
MTVAAICWIYVVLLLAGGLMGFIKAKSKASLIASCICAIPVVLCALAIIPPQSSVWIFGSLSFLFGMRLAQSRKMMPNGVMLILSVLALIGIVITRG